MSYVSLRAGQAKDFDRERKRRLHKNSAILNKKTLSLPDENIAVYRKIKRMEVSAQHFIIFTR
jgi:hypothetical protein